MRPLSFTRNLGGFKKVYDAIRAGYTVGVTVKQFRKRCGLSDSLSLLVTEFFLATQADSHDEFIVGDSLIAHTLSQPFSRLTARLYFFALNLNMPGERIKDDHRNPAEMQNTLLREHLFHGDGFRAEGFDKDRSIEPIVRSFGGFRSDDARRKWVNNYSYLVTQCEFSTTPDGRVETFADTWGALAFRLFFERYVAVNPTSDVNVLVTAAQFREVHKLIGVPQLWLDERIVGAAEMFVSDQSYVFQGFSESDAERRAAERGTQPPRGGDAQRRESLIQQIIRRGENRRYLQTAYGGECQLSGVRLLMPNGLFSVDCAHIKPLGAPHNGEDVVANMLSLSPTMHRLFDRGCVQIDPNTFAIRLLYGNTMPHRTHLLRHENHIIDPANLAYHNTHVVRI